MGCQKVRKNLDGTFRGVRIVFACVRPLTLQKQSLRPRCLADIIARR